MAHLKGGAGTKPANHSTNAGDTYFAILTHGKQIPEDIVSMIVLV